jgi:transcription initiation factor TFIIIB Brf1 subunit/transcription initiation factor TFIIB
LNDTIITDPKSEDIVCNKYSMAIPDSLLEMKPEWLVNIINEREIKARIGLQQSSLASHDMGLSTPKAIAVSVYN